MLLLQEPVAPMLATLIDEPFDSEDWIFEVKWDGYRALAYIQKKKVMLLSRKGNIYNEKFASIAKALEKVQHDCIIDGEIVAYDADGKPAFEAIQNVTPRTRLKYVVFDLLYLDGEDLTDLPLLERKQLLRKILPRSKFIQFSTHVEGAGKKAFRNIVASGGEGVIAKRKDSRYTPGVRSQEWLKCKSILEDDVVIAGFTEPRGSRKYFGSLVLGQWEGKGKRKVLRFVGHAGTGFRGTALKDLHQKMLPLVTEKNPFQKKVEVNAPVSWLRPQLVAQVQFSERTSGGSMRHPVFVGLREDKPAREAVREKVVHVGKAIQDAEKGERARTASGGRRKSARSKQNDQPHVTHPEKIFFPTAGLTKADLVDYYKTIAPYLLPFLVGRPESLWRHPHGAGQGDFFQKNMKDPVPDFAETVKVPHTSSGREGYTNYLVCNNVETLVYMVNLGCIEIHPWLSRVESLDNPEFMVIDIDPADVAWRDVIAVTREVKKVLDSACETSYLKTSGKRGLHVYVPIHGQYTYDDVRTFVEIVGLLVREKFPDLVSLERSPAKRKKMIYIDYLRNARAQTIVAPYSVRATDTATVSTPLKWSELRVTLNPERYTLKTVPKRVKKLGDLWASIHKTSVDLQESLACLQREMGRKLKK